MAKPFKIIISSDGMVMTSVYNDLLDSSQIGIPRIHRATEVCFNNEKKSWEVSLLRPLFVSEELLMGGFKSRAAALDYEVAYLNANMEGIIANKRSGDSGAAA